MAAATASSRSSFPFSACSGYAAGVGGPGPGGRSWRQRETQAKRRAEAWTIVTAADQVRAQQTSLPTAGPSADLAQPSSNTVLSSNRSHGDKPLQAGVNR